MHNTSNFSQNLTNLTAH